MKYPIILTRNLAERKVVALVLLDAGYRRSSNRTESIRDICLDEDPVLWIGATKDQLIYLYSEPGEWASDAPLHLYVPVNSPKHMLDYFKTHGLIHPPIQ